MGRMRTKKNLHPRMARCAAYQEAEPGAHKGRWRTALPGKEFSKILLEIGCGKGMFAVQTAVSQPDTLVLAMDRVAEALVVGMERAAEQQTDNLRFILGDAADCTAYFAPGELDALCLNFSDPWPGNRHAKRRLTCRALLENYREILGKNGEVRIKTDNRALFDFTINECVAAGYTIHAVRFDLHAKPDKNICTEYETRFVSQGLPIYQIIASPGSTR